jgi:ketosteroid isomerase-like protein
MEAFNRRDRDAWLALNDPEVEFHADPEWPESGVIAGREEVWDFAVGLTDAWEQDAFELIEVIDAGDDMLVARYRRPVQGKASGIADVLDYWCVHTFRRAKLLSHEWFASRAEALEAAGLSQENVEIVRGLIDAANRGDWEATIEHAAPGFVWDNSRAIGTDNRVVLTSAEQARDFFKELNEIWESFRVEIDDVIPIGGSQVVVPHTTHIRGRDGIEAQARTTWLFTIRNGQIERVCLYQDKAEALEAAGLSE